MNTCKMPGPGPGDSDPADDFYAELDAAELLSSPTIFSDDMGPDEEEQLADLQQRLDEIQRQANGPLTIRPWSMKV